MALSAQSDFKKQKNDELAKIRQRNKAKRVSESQQIVIDSTNRIALPKLGDLNGRF